MPPLVITLTLAWFGQPATVSVDLSEALQLGLRRSYELRAARMQREDAEAQVDGAWGNALPRVDLTASYTRNLKSPNPFAGADVSALFGGAATGWLTYNEAARTDGDPATNPISLREFNQRQAAGRAAAGVAPPSASDNPFLVENAFNAGLKVTQVLYSGEVFAGIRASKVVQEAAALGVDRQAQLVVQQVGKAYYGALLARAQVALLDQSVARTAQTVAETGERVAQGVVPQLALLTAEVDLANYQTQRLRADSAAQDAVEGLKIALGLPGEVRLSVRGTLTATAAGALKPPSPTDALGLAYTQRPDLAQLERSIEGYTLQESATRAQFTPSLRAIFNLGYQGSVPDDRTLSYSVADDPFRFERQERGFFSEDYWGLYANIGLVLSWNLFDGLGTRATLRRHTLATDTARLRREQLREVIRAEVEQALRQLATAKKQLSLQDKNLSRAELNHAHGVARVREGVSSAFELRVVAEQLDQTRLARLQAIYTLLVAQLNYDVAVGRPPVAEEP